MVICVLGLALDYLSFIGIVGRHEPRCLIFRGSVWAVLGDMNKATNCFNEAIQRDPKFAQGYYARAMVRESIKDYDGANKDCSQAIMLQPTDTKSLFLRAGCRANLGDNSGAVRDLDKVLELKTHFENRLASVHGLRGCFRLSITDRPLSTKDYQDSIADLNRYLESNPQNESDSRLAIIYASRGLSKDKIGDHKGAQEDFGKAKQLDPNVPLPLSTVIPLRKHK